MAAEEVHSLNDSNEHWVCMYVQRTSTVDVYHSLSAKVSCEADNLYFILPPPSLLSGPSTARVNQVVANMAFAIATAISLCQ